MHKEFKNLDQKAMDIAQKFRQVEGELIDVLQECEAKRIFLYFQFTSLFEYAVKRLKLSESNAYNFITVARKAREIPEIKAEIKNGNITVSKAKKIASVINKDNSSLWLEKARTLPREKLEKEVAKVSPKEAVSEKAKYISENRLNLQLGISEELFKKIKRVQDLLSQKKRKAVSIEEAMDELTKDYIQRHDPLEKAKRMESKTKKNNSKPSKNANLRFPGTASWQRRPLPAQVKHKEILRDHGQCSFVNKNGQRCSSQKWIDFHHEVPVSRGGLNTPENLQLLCANHHRLVHSHAG